MCGIDSCVALCCRKKGEREKGSDDWKRDKNKEVGRLFTVPHLASSTIEGD